MEDAHMALPDFDVNRQLGLFGVFDGHGGSAVASVVSRRLPEIIKGLDSYRKGQYRDALYHAFLMMDNYLDSADGRKDIMNVSTERGEEEQDDVSSEDFEDEDDEDEDFEIATGGKKETKVSDSKRNSAAAWARAAGPDGMGCTSVVALLKGGPEPEVWVANAGDSRCVLIRGSSAFALSKDHKPTLATEKQRIVKAGGFVNEEGRVDGNLNLSRAHGDFLYKKDKSIGQTEQKISCEAEMRHTHLTAADGYLLLGCDGIFEKVSNQKLVDFVLGRLHAKICKSEAQQPKLSSICSSFLNANLAISPMADSGLGCDNMSLMMVELGGSVQTTAMIQASGSKAPRVQRTIRKKAPRIPDAYGVLKALGTTPRTPYFHLAKLSVWNDLRRRGRRH